MSSFLCSESGSLRGGQTHSQAPTGVDRWPTGLVLEGSVPGEEAPRLTRAHACTVHNVPRFSAGTQE